MSDDMLTKRLSGHEGIRQTTVAATIAVAGLSVSAPTMAQGLQVLPPVEALAQQYGDVVPEGALPVAAEVIRRGGTNYTYVKYRIPTTGDVSTLILDADGRITDADEVPSFSRSLFDSELEAAFAVLNSVNDNVSLIEVDVFLPNSASLPEEGAPLDMSSEATGSRVTYSVDGREESAAQIAERTTARSQSYRTYLRSHAAEMRRARTQFLQLNAIPLSQVTENALSLGRFSVLVNRTQLASIERRASASDTPTYVELNKEFVPHITSELQWTNIWTDARFGVHQGTGIGIYQTEPSCGPDGFMPNYDIYQNNSGPNDPGLVTHGEYMARIMRTVSPSAPILCHGDVVIPTLNVADTSSPKLQLANISAGQVTSSSDYTGTDSFFDNGVFLTDLTYVISSGNGGGDDLIVDPPGRAANAITVGNVDISPNPDVVHWSSSWRNSTLGNNKPEVMAPGSNTDIPQIPASAENPGTSQSAAHTSGFVANLMNSNSMIRRNPHLAKALVMSGATKSVVGGPDKVGVGGIDYRNTSQHYKLYNFRGDSDAYDTYDEFDDGGADGNVERSFYLGTQKPNVRVSIAWSSLGSHVLDTDTLAADYELEVYAPNGQWLGGSYNIRSPYESIDFVVTQSGNHRFVITRETNFDSDANLRLGMAINFDN